MAADDEEAALNKNAGADSVAFASALLGDEEGVSPKENMLTPIVVLAEAITEGVVSTNDPK